MSGPRGRARTLTIAALCALAASGCATFLPLQTASTVPEDQWRLSVQGSLSPWCSLTSTPENCHAWPAGTPSPELRFGARRGLAQGLDVGASLRGQAVSGQSMALDVGVLAEVKKELWSRALGENRRQLVSLGLGAGIGAAGNDHLVIGQADAVLPVYFGHQTLGEEYFATVRATDRLTFGYPAVGGLANVAYFGTSVGLVWRRTGFGIQVSYDAPVLLANRGAITVSTGFLWTP